MKSKIRFHGQYYKDEDSIKRVVQRINERNSLIKDLNEELIDSKFTYVKKVKLERKNDFKKSISEVKKIKKQDLFLKFKENKSKLILKREFAIDDKH